MPPKQANGCGENGDGEIVPDEVKGTDKFHSVGSNKYHEPLIVERFGSSPFGMEETLGSQGLGSFCEHASRTLESLDTLTIWCCIATNWPQSVSMFEWFCKKLRHVGLDRNPSKTKLCTTVQVDAPQYANVGSEMVGVLHRNATHGYLGQKLPGNLKTRGRVEFDSSTNKHVSNKFQMELLDANNSFSYDPHEQFENFYAYESKLVPKS